MRVLIDCNILVSAAISGGVCLRAIIEEVALRADYLIIPANPPQTEEMVDADDLVYVIAAHVGNADAIVTGNTAHFTAPTYGNALVVTAREFLDMVGG